MQKQSLMSLKLLPWCMLGCFKLHLPPSVEGGYQPEPIRTLQDLTGRAEFEQKLRNDDVWLGFGHVGWVSLLDTV